jgi:hypothetical protein
LPIVLPISNGRGHRQRRGIVAAVGSENIAAAAAEAGLKRCGFASLSLFARNDVDHAGGAFGLKLRRRRGEDFNSLDVLGRDRL